MQDLNQARIITNSNSLDHLLNGATTKDLVSAPIEILPTKANEDNCNVVVLDYAALSSVQQNDAELTKLLRTIKHANGMKTILVNYGNEEMAGRFFEAGLIVDYILPGQVTPTRTKATVHGAYRDFLGERDALTKTYNRGYLTSRLEEAVEDTKKTLGTVGFTLLDLDKFKCVNDEYGHNTGDVALRTFAGVMKSCSLKPDRDIIGRWGGEEFVIISLQTDLTGAYNLAEKIRIKMGQTPIPQDKGELIVTVSGGVIAYDGVDTGITYKELVGKADQLLYQAKNLGRNRICR